MTTRAFVVIVEGDTDRAAIPVFIRGIAELDGHEAKIVEVLAPPGRCARIRLRAGELVRARQREATHAVIVTDAWCNPGAFRGEKRTDKARALGTCCTGEIRDTIARDVERSAPNVPTAIGVACADLETWFMSSDAAMKELGASTGRLDFDPQAACDDERVEIAVVGCGRLEGLVERYDSRKAGAAAAAMVRTPENVTRASAANASFNEFVSAVRALFEDEEAPPSARGRERPRKGASKRHR